MAASLMATTDFPVEDGGDLEWSVVAKKTPRMKKDKAVTARSSSSDKQKLSESENKPKESSRDGCLPTTEKRGLLMVKHLGIINDNAEELKLNSENDWPTLENRTPLHSTRSERSERIGSSGYWSSTSQVGSVSQDSPGQSHGPTLRSSYSLAVKISPKQGTAPKEFTNETKDYKPIQPSQDVSETEEIAKKKKKKKKKTTSAEQASAPSVKKTKDPVTLDFTSLLENLSLQSSGQKKTEPQHSATKQKSTSLESAPRNLLDSTAPAKKRGKEREEPKSKKPTALRRVLIKEREERQQLRQQHQEIPENLDVVSTLGIRESVEIPPICEEISSKPKGIHNRKFREYCSHMNDPEMEQLTCTMLSELLRFQDRVYHNEPQKYMMKRRYICGLREVLKHLKLKKLKLVIMACNLDRITSTGGINDHVYDIIQSCRDQEIPILFTLTKQQLGKILYKKVPVSVVGIFSYDGAERYYKLLMEKLELAKDVYRKRIEVATQSTQEDSQPFNECIGHNVQQPNGTESLSREIYLQLLQGHSKSSCNEQEDSEVTTMLASEPRKPFQFNVNASIFVPNIST